MNWNYKQPVEIIFGSGRISELNELISQYDKPLLVSDPFFKTNGLIDRIKKIANIEYVFSNVSANPDVTEVDECSRLIRENGIDVIIALGGGSSLDLAKAASIAADSIEPFHNGEKAVPETHLPVIAIPTTSGTGSEVTCVSVLTNRRTGKKSPIVSQSFYPKTALIDPELSYSLPPAVTASTGIDVLCHAVEGYWSKAHQPICDALAVYAVKLVFEYLPKAYAEPNNKTAREKMAEASVIAGLAFTLPKTTSSHACSFPLTGIYHIPHGEACELTLDYFVRINGSDAHTQSLINELGYSNADRFAEDIVKLKKRLGLRIGLSDFNIGDDDIQQLVKRSHHPNLNNNPVEITDDILFDLYRILRKL